MPTNLPPDYYEIEKRFRVAESAAEKVGLLEEMYSVVPKHKGTDHLRADLRRQLSRLKEEAQQARKKHGGGVGAFHVEREGVGQAAVIGAANTGKSTLVRALTNAEPEVSDAPFTTWKPAPGMMVFENVQIQLIDTPPIEREAFVEPALFDLLRRSDVLLLMVDLQADPLAQLDGTLEMLAEHRLAPIWREKLFEGQERMIFKPVIVLANMCDNPDEDDNCNLFCQLIDPDLPVIPVSALKRRNLEQIGQQVYQRLGLVRVYARPPGKEPDLELPFVMKAGGTVKELALRIHKDFYENLKIARVWGSSLFEGQMVQRDYVLQEGDIVELKT
jgi:ribosome-interacting GTPase 1